MPTTNMLDVFDSDPFRNVSLTAWVNTFAPFTPGFLSTLPGLFDAQGIMTLDAAFDQVNGDVRLISASPRSSPPSQKSHPKVSTMRLPAKHFSREVTITADELMGTRIAGTLDQATAETILAARVEPPFGVKTEWGATLEHLKLGAIQGTVYDADNTTVLYDYFTQFGIARPADVNFPFSTATADTGTIATTAQALRRTMLKALNGMAVAQSTCIALCGDNFFDALTGCKELVAARKTGALGNQDASDLIGVNLAYGSLQYAKMLFINYRGTDDLKITIPTDEARAFMTGVPGLFQELYAPADTFETISVAGLPFYMLNDPNNANNDKRRVWELQSNPILACTRPGSLVRLTKS